MQKHCYLGLDSSWRLIIIKACFRYIDSQPSEAVSSDPITHYILVRQDVPRGLQSAQIVHAAGESSPGNLPPGTYVVVLAVANEAVLRAFSEKLEAHGIQHKLIVENSNDYQGQAMAIGVVPQPRSQLRRYFSSLPLLK